MTDTIVSFETAKLAKEKGFDEPCYDCYNPHGMRFSNGWCEYIYDNGIEIPFDNEDIKEKDILAPTQSLLQKWLREIYSIDVYVAPRINSVTGIREYWATLFTIDCSMTISTDTHKSFEEVLEEGLYRALLQIPDKKNK